MNFWVIAVTASLAASGALAKSHNRHAQNKHTADAGAFAPHGDPNGSWSIEAATSVGACAALIPTGITIADNKIESAAGAGVSSWGYVDEAGNIVARFTGDGGRVARFHGTVKGGKGSGAWSSSTDMCGGTWRGTRR
jgi:hypothetical protein